MTGVSAYAPEAYTPEEEGLQFYSNIIETITLDEREKDKEPDFDLTRGKAENIPASMGVTKVLIYLKSHSATPGPNGIPPPQSKYNQLSQLHRKKKNWLNLRQQEVKFVTKKYIYKQESKLP